MQHTQNHCEGVWVGNQHFTFDFLENLLCYRMINLQNESTKIINIVVNFFFNEKIMNISMFYVEKIYFLLYIIKRYIPQIVTILHSQSPWNLWSQRTSIFLFLWFWHKSIYIWTPKIRKIHTKRHTNHWIQYGLEQFELVPSPWATHKRHMWQSNQYISYIYFMCSILHLEVYFMKTPTSCGVGE